MMDEQLLENILSAHADGLNLGIDSGEQLQQVYGDHCYDLMTFLSIARSLKHILVPIEPPTAFVSILKEDLLEQIELADRPPAVKRRWVLLGAIASIVATAVGVVVWFYRRPPRAADILEPVSS